MKNNLLLTILLLNSIYSTCQQRFYPNTKLYVNGNSALIGNNILSKHSKKSINENLINDFTEMKFIDVDDNAETFSSSQANLKLIEANAEIEYAALYWSAIYASDKGKKELKSFKRKGKLYKKYVYKGNDTRSTNVNTVLFKTPNSNYNRITGKVIFDAFNIKDTLPETKPYVCYADVTQLLKNNTPLNGTYTVANIKATEGFVSGGSAGGWLLYVIYKSKTATPKYFTTYNGFLCVYREPVTIRFNDFKTPEEGKIETSLLLGALEGDQKFKSDHCSFYNYQTNSYTPLSNNLRPKLNFFNSTISIDNTNFIDRHPNSVNTFGFDALKFKLPNKNNSLIAPNISEATLQLNSKADQFYLFFVAFETEISPIYKALKNDENAIVVLHNNNNTSEDEGLTKIKKLKTTIIPSVEKGYYLVTNVFSKKNNAANWIKNLKDKGYTPKSFVNPENGWIYVYLDINLNPIAIYQKQKEFLKLNDFKDIWVLKINL